MKRRFSLLLLVIISNIKFSVAQKIYDKEILFSDENDFFLLNGQDSYYTNGFFFQFSKALSHKDKKTINRFSLAQTMYTTRNRRAVWSGYEPLDRPYCGYLFGRFTHDKFVNKDQLFSYSIEVGGTGDNALAKKLYTWYHKELGLFEYPYWDLEIPTSFGINGTVKYAKSQISKNNKWQITPTIEATAGNYFLNAKLGAYFTTGNFSSINNSVLFNSVIDANAKTTSKKQLIYYLYPQLIFQGYNVTIQGVMNNHYDSTVFTAKPQPVIFQTTLGVAYAKSRITAKAEYIFQTREVIDQLSNHRWVGLHLGYRF